MGLSYKQRQQLLAESKPAAAAFMEDIAHIREVVKSASPAPGQVRLLSNILRRLLVNRELNSVSAPRIDKFHIVAPDNNAYTSNKPGVDIVLYQSGSPLLFPMLQNYLIEFKRKDSENGSLGIQFPSSVITGVVNTQILVRLDGFLSQKVICFRGKWASRQDVIKYAAICGSGVHTETATKAVDKMLDQARLALRFTKQGNEPAVQMDFEVIGNPHHPPPATIDFSYDPNRIDLVLVELLAAAYYLCESPDIDNLERSIREELGCV